MARVFNFSAGPSMLPLPVLQKAQAELTEYGCSGQSVPVSYTHLDVYKRQDGHNSVCCRAGRFSLYD